MFWIHTITGDTFSKPQNKKAAIVAWYPQFFKNMVPSLKRCLLTGSLGFCGASIIVFATVAFAERWMYGTFGLGLSYLIWTLLFIGGGWAVFNSLVVGPQRGLRFFVIFGAAFLAYAVGWVGAYFVLRGAVGEWCGSLAGSVLMGCVLAAGFRVWRSVAFLSTLLFVANSLGYFLGSALNTSVGGKVGMMLWGVVYGLCLGAGIGAVLHYAQKNTAQPDTSPE